jgi:hypothetical protein
VLLAGAIPPAGTYPTRRTTTPFQGIHNNLVENAIRPTAIGKKNWLFIGDKDAGERAAILYTIIESCRRHHIDPFAYLRDTVSVTPSLSS